MLAQNTQARIHELLYTLEHIDLSVKEYRDDVVKRIITKVVVLSADRIQITFDNNMEMEQELPREKNSRRSRKKMAVLSPLGRFSAIFQSISP